MKKIKLDIIICIFLTIVLLIFISQLPGITPVARVYPIGVIAGSFICILGLLIQTLRSTARESGELVTTKIIKRIFFYMLLVLAYILLWEWLGYIITTFAFTLISLLFLGMKNKIALTIFPTCITAVIYFMFTNFLMVSLPNGALIELFL